MAYFIVKTLITALIIAGISELSNRYTIWAALLASLPLTSILAFIWIYYDTSDVEKISELSYSIFWLVVPSMVFFLILPFLLKKGIVFGLALLISTISMGSLYAAGIYLAKIIKS